MLVLWVCHVHNHHGEECGPLFNAAPSQSPIPVLSTDPPNSGSIGNIPCGPCGTRVMANEANRITVTETINEKKPSFFLRFPSITKLERLSSTSFGQEMKREN